MNKCNITKNPEEMFLRELRVRCSWNVTEGTFVSEVVSARVGLT